jgi:hypothetical protein
VWDDRHPAGQSRNGDLDVSARLLTDRYNTAGTVKALALEQLSSAILSAATVAVHEVVDSQDRAWPWEEGPEVATEMDDSTNGDSRIKSRRHVEEPRMGQR